MADYTWRIQHDLTHDSPLLGLLQGWASAIEAETGGRLAIELYIPGAIVNPADAIEATQTGVLQGAFASLDAGLDPRLEILRQPFVAGGGDAEARAAFTTLQTDLADAFGGLALMAGFTQGSNLFSASPIASPADLAGLRVSAHTQTARDYLEAVQASPVQLPHGEVYPALERGIIDAALISTALDPTAMGLGGVASNMLAFPDQRGPLIDLKGLVLNEAALSALPADLQAIIEANSGLALSAAFGRTAEAMADDQLAAFEATDTVHSVTGAELAAWQASAQLEIAQNLDALSSGGFDAHAAFESYTSLLDSPDFTPGGGDPGPGDADITGTDGPDTIAAVDGDTRIDGGGGSDTVAYGGVRADFSATLAADGTITVTKPDGSTDTLLSIERTSFADGDLIFDLPSANAPAAYRLYGGAFDRIPDEGGLRFWINAVDAGLSLRDAAAGFIDSPEFGALYGTGLSNAAFIDQLYLNVLGRPGEADGVTFWNTYLDGGGDRAETLVQFTQLPEYVGLSQADIENGYWVG